MIVRLLPLALALVLYLGAILTFGLGFYLFPVGLLVAGGFWARGRADGLVRAGVVAALVFGAQGALFVALVWLSQI